MIEPSVSEGPTFNFHFLNNECGAFKDKDVAASFEKWGLAKHSRFYRFRFDEYFRAYDLPRFVDQFFNAPDVKANLQTVSRSGAFNYIGSAEVKEVKYDQLKCDEISMEFFDRVQDGRIVRENGNICKMFEEDCEGVLLHDKLQQMFVDEAGENWTKYTETERKELLFAILKHLVLGGGINQYEDNIEPYLAAAKLIYKDLVVVQKNPTTGKIEVASTAVSVRGVDSTNLWPFDSLQNFCLLSIDPIKRHVVVWYGAYIPPW